MQLEILLNWWLKGSNDSSCALKITWGADCHLAIKNLVELKVSRESAWFTGELTSREGCLLVSRAQLYWGIFLLPSARPHHHHTPAAFCCHRQHCPHLLNEATAPTNKVCFPLDTFLFLLKPPQMNTLPNFPPWTHWDISYWVAGTCTTNTRRNHECGAA